jgi:hypothetical protein
MVEIHFTLGRLRGEVGSRITYSGRHTVIFVFSAVLVLIHIACVCGTRRFTFNHAKPCLERISAGNTLQV